MSLVIVQHLSLSYGKKTLFDDDELTIGPTDRIGLVGANGTGKSTLMKILAGRLQPDSGTIQYMRRAKAGYLPQDIVQVPTGTLVDSVMSAVPGREGLDGRIVATEEALSKGVEDPDEQMELAQELADLHEERDHFEDHYGRHVAEKILNGLGFKPLQLEQPVASLSGGWRMRAALAGLLLQDPDLLLLDEPTNHLDLPTLSWFDAFLRRSKKAMVLISHDRDFLNRQIKRVVSLEVEGLRTYSGNYEQYKAQRALEVEQLQNRAERQEARRAELQAFIDRFGAKATKARQAQSRQKMLDKMEQIETLQEREKVRIKFPESPKSGRDVAAVKEITKRYGDNVVYDHLSARLERGQRVAVVGVNGAGKTTLLKILAGELEPDKGSVEVGHNVVMGYYAQHHADTLDPKKTVLDEVSALVPDRPQSYVRSVLGAFLFHGDDVEKPIGVLSGGERARVALAKLLLRPANLLLMDEPTNHLDLDSSEALIEALKGYDGTLLFVSHNRSFLNQLATTVWEVRDRQVIPYPGNLDDYLYKLEQNAKLETASGNGAPVAKSSAPMSEKERKRAEAEERQRRSAVEGPVKKEIARLEARIAEMETKAQTAEAALADPGVYDDFNRARPHVESLNQAKSELEKLYAEWEAKQLELESLRPARAE
ncbi:MAG: ABC-F family ATP-binding cassette domain-containing protein [Myxococcaceae bacterium]